MANSLAVLGGTGFFGKSFLDAFRRGLLARWDIGRIIVVARHPETLRVEHPELIVPGVELVALDVCTTTSLPVADYIIHAANTTDARRYAADPAGERAAILAAADNFARCLGVAHRGSRIVYTSSGAVYGQQAADVVGLDEDAPLTAANGLIAYKRDYAEAKRLAEARIAALGATDMNVAIARCFAFVGAYLPRDQHFAIGNFLGDGVAGRPVVVKARHAVYRSYLHADDLVAWLLTIADNASSACPIVNVGSDEAILVSDVARRVARACGVAAEVPAITASSVDRYVPSVARARRLGLAPNVTLDAAIEMIVDRWRSEVVATPASDRQWVVGR